jgi:hypothetical protein
MADAYCPASMKRFASPHHYLQGRTDDSPTCEDPSPHLRRYAAVLAARSSAPRRSRRTPTLLDDAGDRSSRPRCGCSRSTNRDEGCRRTWSSIPRCCCTDSSWKCRSSRRRSPSAGWRDGSRTASSSDGPIGSFGRRRCTEDLAIGDGEVKSFNHKDTKDTKKISLCPLCLCGAEPLLKKHVSNRRRQERTWSR